LFLQYIPLRLVNNFNEERTNTVQIQGHKTVCGVGACKHDDDHIVLKSGWSTFVASHCIKENDLLIFLRSKENARLEVFILDPSGRVKTSSRSAIGNCPKKSDDSVRTVGPTPQRETIDLSISDDDDIMREGTKKSCRAENRVARSSAKSLKRASTSSPSTKSGILILVAY
jgi:hypothetical protein